MQRPFRRFDLLSLNIYWFALTAYSQTVSPLILPLLVEQFIGESGKGTALGTVRLWALMSVVVFQAFVGAATEHSTHPLGRRRPFILIGSLGQIILFGLIGYSTRLDGTAGYAALFGLYILSMFASNTAHVGVQGLIPDLIPEDQRRPFSIGKALLELPLPLVFVAFVLGQMIARGNLWGALIVLMVIVALCTGITLTAREKRLENQPYRLTWLPFLRLGGVSAVFTAIILVTGALLRWFLAANFDLPRPQTMLLTGAVGVAAIGIAIALGTAASLRLEIGTDSHYPPTFKWWAANRLVFLAASTNVATFLVFFLQEQYPQLPGQKAAGPAAIFLMIVGFFLLLAVLANRLTRKIGRQALVILGGLLSLGGTLVMLAGPDLPALYLAAGLIGAGTGLHYPASWSLGVELIPSEQAGRFLALANLTGAGVGALGAYLAGPIADRLGYSLVMAIYAALFLLSTLAGLGARKQPTGNR